MNINPLHDSTQLPRLYEQSPLVADKTDIRAWIPSPEKKQAGSFQKKLTI
jgi:hypothetical protein